MPRNSQVGPLAMPWTLPVAVEVVWKILLEAPPTPSPAGAVAGGAGAWACAFGATAAAPAPQSGRRRRRRRGRLGVRLRRDRRRSHRRAGDQHRPAVGFRLPIVLG